MAITAVAAIQRRQLPCLLVGWLWFLGMLVPVIGLVGNFLHARADRYTYLSQIGLSIALAWSVWMAYQSLQSRRPARWRQSVLAIASAATILLLAGVAFRQTSYWSDRETLWTRALACNPKNLVAHYSLALAYAEQQRTDEAIAELRAGLAVDSTAVGIRSLAHTLLAQCLTKQGKAAEAHRAVSSRRCVSCPPTVARMAGWRRRSDRRDMQERALAEWREAVRLDPARAREHGWAWPMRC